MTRRAALLAALFVLGVPSHARASQTAAAAAVPSAALPDPQREAVAVIGDSLSENAYLPHPERQSLGPQLREALTRRGVDPGAGGFLPAHPATLSGISAPIAGWPVRYSGQWVTTTGVQPGTGSALESWSSDPHATASVGVRAHAVAALVEARGDQAGRFVFSADNRSVEVTTDPGRSGLQLAWLGGDEAHTLGLRLLNGTVGLLGFFARNPVLTGQQIEVSMLSRGGARAADPVGPLDAAGLALLRPGLTVIALGTNDAILAAFGDRTAEDRMAAGLGRLASTARRSGRCVMILPPRAPIIASVSSRFDRRIRAVAQRRGCRTASVWEHVLDRPGRRIGDQLHPSVAGVRAMARALLPVLPARQRATR